MAYLTARFCRPLLSGCTGNPAGYPGASTTQLSRIRLDLDCNAHHLDRRCSYSDQGVHQDLHDPGGQLSELKVTFEREQPALGWQSSAVARESPIAANDAVAGNNNGHWIGAVGHTNCAGGSWATDSPGNFCIGACLSIGYMQQFLPHCDLEGSTM